MAVPVQQLLMEVSRLTELQGVRVALKESFKGAAITGVSTLVGGLLFGPIGLAIGGTVGGCSAAAMASNNFRSIPQVILHDLTPRQRENLVAAILAAVRAIPIRDAVDFATTVAQDPALATTVAMAVITFLNSQPGMHIVD